MKHKIRVRVRERLSATPGHVIGQGPAPGGQIVPCGGGSGGGSGGGDLKKLRVYCMFGKKLKKLRVYCIVGKQEVETALSILTV